LTAPDTALRAMSGAHKKRPESSISGPFWDPNAAVFFADKHAGK
jgi:hypothetical protein